jgi:asparagine synthase (glutamine-hydrolysing)
MCGICGIVQVGGEPRDVVPVPVLDSMTDCMTHRGPNDRGTWNAPGIAMGVRRLSIVDVEGGHQPFANEDNNVVAIQNGELYNHVQLRRELRERGHAFRSRCDTEVLPHLYEEYGDDFPALLRGKFGIAVWDARNRRAVLVRDRLGVKPLYWAQVDDCVVFASELKSILRSGLLEPNVDVEAIDLLLTLGFVPGPRTPIVGVNKLTPGAILVIDGAGAREHTYWEYPEPQGTGSNFRSVDECGDELLSLLQSAVRDRLMSDVPVGAMLSGGLDSSLIVALMSRDMAEPVQTFSVGFEEDRANELDDARNVAQLFGCRHHEVRLSVEDDTLDLTALVRHMDEPVADLSALGFDIISSVAAEHVTVALCGQGADELFGGYTKHRVASALSTLTWLPDVGRRLLGEVPWPSGRIRRAARALAAPDPSQRLLALSGRLELGQRRDLYRGELARVNPSTAYRTVMHAQGSANGHPLSSLLYLDAKLGLVDDMLLYFDRTSMAHSLEVRVPFLDHRLVEWAATVPPEMKVHRGVTKHVLKHVARSALPEATVTKRKVGFFRFAMNAWLLAQLRRGGSELLSSPEARYREFLDGAAVGSLVSTYVDRPNEDRARLVFAVMLLETWLGVIRTQTP